MPRRKLQIQQGSNSELALLAKYGDSEALSTLWARMYEVAVARARKFCRKYRHIDADDLANSAAMHFPKILDRYNPSLANFDRYAGIAIYRACQDELRKDDPLGVQIPQRSHYPMFTHLSSLSEYDSDTLGVIEDGLSRLDKGYVTAAYE